MYDSRTALLAQMVVVLEAETAEAFRDVTPETAAQRAEELGRRHWAHWGHAIRFAMDFARPLGVDVSFETGVDRWLTLAERAEEFFPALPADARRDFRAVGFLLWSITPTVMADPNGRKAAEEAVDLFAEPSEKVPQELLRYMGLLQALGAAGLRGGFPPGVPEALARAFWALVRDPLVGRDDDAIEDAYWAAEAAEARLRREPTIPVTEYQPSARA